MDSVRGIAKIFRKIDLKNQSNDFSYWQTQPYEKRLAALEQIRREYHGWDHDSEPRLQRIYRIIKR